MRGRIDAGSSAGRSLLFLLPFLVAALLPASGRCQTGGAQGADSRATEGISKERAASLAKFLDGEWVGARLLCRKEAGGAVRCGKPVAFAVTFNEDGTGTSMDEHFPNAFSYSWKSKSELVLAPDSGGEELTLFQLEIKEGSLTFQTYIYLALKDPSLPKEANYIHDIFDVNRVE